jgi:hypothetical protein
MQKTVIGAVIYARSRIFAEKGIPDSLLGSSRRQKKMPRTFLITYRAVLKHRTMKIEAFSKYDAKQRFYRMYPKYEIVNIEEAEKNEDEIRD